MHGIERFLQRFCYQLEHLGRRGGAFFDGFVQSAEKLSFFCCFFTKLLLKFAITFCPKICYNRDSNLRGHRRDLSFEEEGRRCLKSMTLSYMGKTGSATWSTCVPRPLTRRTPESFTFCAPH